MYVLLLIITLATGEKEVAVRSPGGEVQLFKSLAACEAQKRQDEAETRPRVPPGVTVTFTCEKQ